MLDINKNNDKFLVESLIEGNNRAFRILFEKYKNDIYKFSLGFLGSKTYAEEIVQDVFLKIWIKRESLNPDLSFKSYLFTIARNQNLKFLQKAANHLKLRDEIFYKRERCSNSTDLHIREYEMKIVKEDAMNRLPPKRRLIFEMSRNEGKSYEDIAEELGISLSTVRNQMSKALETLRDFLLDHKEISLALVLFFKNWL